MRTIALLAALLTLAACASREYVQIADQPSLDLATAFEVCDAHSWGTGDPRDPTYGRLDRRKACLAEYGWLERYVR